MKATLEFNLPEDKYDFKKAIDGSKWSSVAWDMDQYLRTRLKYEDSISDDEYKAVEAARSHLRELIIDSGLSLDD